MNKIKQWFKSKTILFNTMAIPVVTYLMSVPELWTSYAGQAANALIIFGNIYLRFLTTKPLSEKFRAISA